MMQVDSVAIVQLQQFRSEWSEHFNLAILTATGLRVLGALLVGWLAFWALKLFLRQVEKALTGPTTPGVITAQEQRTRTLLSLLRSIGIVIVTVLTVFMVLGSLGVNVGPLLAGAGVVGLAISFGAQSLVKDVLSGLFILFENQFGVGDIIRVEGVGGVVERMTLRVVVLRDVQGVVHVIPNGQITRVANMTRSWARVVLDVAVAYREEPDRVIAVMKSVGEEMYGDEQWSASFIEPPEVPGVESLADSAVNFRIVAKVLPLKQWEIARELRRRLKIRFDREGIQIPFPHRTLFWGEGQHPGAALAGGAGGNGEGNDGVASM
jgi:moderate conductance mechanosensitive channel